MVRTQTQTNSQQLFKPERQRSDEHSGEVCGCAAASPVTRLSPLPTNGQWYQRRRRMHHNPFAGRDMYGESPADEAPAPSMAAYAANSRGRGNSAARGGNGRGGRERGRGMEHGNHRHRPSASPSIGMVVKASTTSRQVSTNTATTGSFRAGTGQGIFSCRKVMSRSPHLVDLDKVNLK